MSDINQFNWKKYAEAIMKQEEAEMAFAKSASAVISSKAAPMFKDPYFLGFEIVQTNDAHTKMVGIFVFRVEKKLFYVPIAYIDGSLKLTDLLYNADEKIFTLLSPEWCDYYVSKIETKVGDLISVNGQNSQDRGTQDMRLRWLAYPPYMTKGACELKRKEGYQAESPLVIFDFLKEAKDIFSQEDFKKALENINNHEKTASSHKSLLHDYVVAGGYEVFNKLASWIEEDYEFANNVATFLSQDDFMPEEVLKAEAGKNYSIKQASENKEEDLIPDVVKNKDGKLLVHLGKFNPFTNKTASEQIEIGYSIEDNRKDGDIEALVVDPTEQFHGAPSGIGYGVYDLLTSGNDIVKTFIITGVSDYDKRPGLIISLEDKEGDKGVVAYDNTTSAGNLSARFGEHKVEPAGVHTQSTPWSSLLCHDTDQTDEQKETDIKKILKDLPEEGKVYGIFDAESSYLSDEAFYIKSISGNKEEGYQIVAAPLAGYTHIASWALGDPNIELTLRINPDALKILTDMKIFTPRTKWVEIPTYNYVEKDEINKVVPALTNGDLTFKPKNNKVQIKLPDWIPGTISNYIKGVNGLGYKQASVRYVRQTDKYEVKFENNKDKKARNKLASTLKLMTSFGFNEEDSDLVLKTAKEKSGQDVKFMYKSAGRIILNPDPEFWEGFDSDLGVKYQVPETIPVMTSDVSIHAPTPRYGDHVPSLTPDIKGDIVSQAESTSVKENENGDVFLRTASPNMLAELSKVTGQNSLFEHGIIGSLAKTHDASLFIGEFLPDMIQGEDKLGRMLFLVNLSPASFISMYGNDDIKSLENNILTIFKQQGELILELLQKNKGTQVNLTTIENNQE